MLISKLSFSRPKSAPFSVSGLPVISKSDWRQLPGVSYIDAVNAGSIFCVGVLVTLNYCIVVHVYISKNKKYDVAYPFSTSTLSQRIL